MEPKPRGLTPNDTGFSRLPWLADAKEDYQAITGEQYTETDFSRGERTIGIVDQILPGMSHRPNILLVGLGLQTYPIKCSYEPFRVAAHLEGLGRDYTMTLVDVDQRVIADVRNRERLYVPLGAASGDIKEDWKRKMNQYAKDTNQTSRVIYDTEEGLIFWPTLTRIDSVPSDRDYLKGGVMVADVSPIFREKRHNGEIRFIQKDIAVADLSQSGPYDLAELTNVLYLMPQEGQQLAIATVTQALLPGGRLLLNDLGGYTGVPVFPEFGGWFDERKMEQLGVIVREVLVSDNANKVVVLQKIA